MAENVKSHAILDTKTNLDRPSSPHNSFAAGELIESHVEKRELKERFSLLGMIGLYYSLGVTPIAIGTYISLVSSLGGGAFLFWGTFTGCACQMFVCLSVAELASAFPHSIGMSFWVTKLSPPKWKRLASYWVAVATVLQIHFDGASSWVITSQTLSATIAVFTHNQVNLEKWQAYLITLGLIIVIIPFNISSKALNKYSKLTNLSAYIINGVVIYQAVTILVRSPSKQSAESVFFSVDNETGWNSLAVVFFLSTLPGTSCVTGFNYLVNMTEEMPAPEKNVPRVMIIVSLLSAIASIIMIALLSYCIVNPESLLNPIGDSPLAQILLDAQQSLALTSINMTAITIIYVNAGLVFITTSSRFLWQVTKHGGLAFASTLGKINLKSQIPQNAIFFASAAYALISLLQVATETVVNAILGFSFICAAISYGVPILLLIFRGRHLLPEDRYFNLGPFGLPINIFAACWLVLSSIMYSFPSYLPITADTMNYAGPVFLGFYSLFIPNWYFYAKRHYVAPESQLRQEKGDIERHLTTGKQEISQEPK